MFWDNELSKWLAVLIAYVLTSFILVILPPLALRIGLTDNPCQRKLHVGQVPLIGGIAMFCGFIFACTLLPVNLQDYRALFAAAGLLVFLGVMDDFKELSPRSRLFGQLLAALFIVGWGRVALFDLGDLFATGQIVLPLWTAWFLSLFAIMSFINALNMMDGLDGLAGIISLLATLALLVLAILHSNDVFIWVLLVLTAAVIAFLQFNWRFHQRAHVFMGDAGSMLLGVVLVWFAIKGSQGELAIARPVTLLWVLALPLCELLTVVLYRLLHRRSPLIASREHMHYLLLQYLKWPVWCVVLLLASFAMLLALVGIAGEWQIWPEYSLFYGFLGVFIAYAASYFWLSKKVQV